jgi:hypothetical protein
MVAGSGELGAKASGDVLANAAGFGPIAHATGGPKSGLRQQGRRLRREFIGMTESHAPSLFVPQFGGRVVGDSILVVRGQPWQSVSNSDRWFGLPARFRSGCGWPWVGVSGGSFGIGDGEAVGDTAQGP